MSTKKKELTAREAAAIAGRASQAARSPRERSARASHASNTRWARIRNPRDEHGRFVKK